jgi:hypothetical protein
VTKHSNQPKKVSAFLTATTLAKTRKTTRTSKINYVSRNFLTILDELDEKADRLGMDDDVVSVSEVSDAIDPEAVQPYDFANLPAHACAYCGVHEPSAVVKCMHADCGKWFCNGKGLSEYGSHIVLHMVKSKHKEI